MGIIQKLFRRKNEERLLQQGGGWTPGPQFATADYLPATVGLFNTLATNDTGVRVDEYTALAASAVYACVSVISNTISSLPLAVMHKTDATKQIDHPTFRVLHDEPNPYMTAPVFRECMMLNLLLWGACYAFIEKDELGNVIALYPLKSAVTRPVRMFGQLLYRTLIGSELAYLTPDQIFCVMNFSLDGISPISPIQQAKQSVGLSIGLERYAAKFFSNGGNLGGVLSLPSGMKEEQVRAFVESWKANYSGIENSLKTALLPGEYKYQQIGTTPENAQAIQARVHQIREVARIYRVPLHLVGDLERGTFSNIESQDIQFASNCIQPWIVKWEAEANRKLFLEAEKPTLELRFNLDGMIRADLAARYASYMQGRQGGWLTVNEIRSKEGLPPVEGGDELLRPLNMAPVGNPTTVPDGKPLIAPPPPKIDGDDDAPLGRSLIEDAAKRVLTKESKALARAVKKFGGKPQELQLWADQWYAQHQPLVARVLAPAMQIATSDKTPEEYAKLHCAESIRAIGAAIDSSGNADDLLDEWETIRPADIADELIKKAA